MDDFTSLGQRDQSGSRSHTGSGQLLFHVEDRIAGEEVPQVHWLIQSLPPIFSVQASASLEGMFSYDSSPHFDYKGEKCRICVSSWNLLYSFITDYFFLCIWCNCNTLVRRSTAEISLKINKNKQNIDNSRLSAVYSLPSQPHLGNVVYSKPPSYETQMIIEHLKKYQDMNSCST